MFLMELDLEAPLLFSLTCTIYDRLKSIFPNLKWPTISMKTPSFLNFNTDVIREATANVCVQLSLTLQRSVTSSASLSSGGTKSFAVSFYQFLINLFYKILPDFSSCSFDGACFSVHYSQRC